MILGLGIDAGGTYTDVVLYDLESGRLQVKAKVLTTHADYSQGIAAALDRIGTERIKQARLVGLSTTLATNALVEGRGGMAGLIMLGYPTYTAEQVHHHPVAHVPGAMNIKGEPLEPLDETLLRREVRRLRDHDRVEALAISGFSAVMNPAHEIRAAELVADEADLPVVLGHQLSQKLNAVHRATTAVLNARLVPLVVRLLDSVGAVLKLRGVSAPVMVVKSDGTLMAEQIARARPIETILSGPAASVIGALHLARHDDALVLDMGGTTLDMAVIAGGRPRQTPVGAAVGKHQTHVASIEIRTVGLGGDSYVQLQRGELLIGPRRVVPLSLLAREHPQVIAGLEQLVADAQLRSALHQPADVFFRLRHANGHHLSDHNRRILEALEPGPLTRVQLCGRINAVHPALLQTDFLERGLWIARAGLTPTDCLHVLGGYRPWDIRAAQLGAELYASRTGAEPRHFCQQVVTHVHHLLAEQCLATVLAEEGIEPGELAGQAIARRLLRRGIEGTQAESGVGIKLVLGKPVIAIGAPVAAYVPHAVRRLDSECIIPPDADVANAVGAVVGKVVVTRSATIDRSGYKKYACHADDGRFIFETLEQAKRFARDHLGAHVRSAAQAAGADQPEVRVEVHDRVAQGIDTEGRLVNVFLESVVTATARGRPLAAPPQPAWREA